MRYFYCLILFFSFSLTAQQNELFEETWYIRNIELTGENWPFFTPLNENFNLQFINNNGTYNAVANGVQNTYSASANIVGNTISFNTQSVTLLDCNEPNCDFEDLFFYSFLTDENLVEKTFIYNYFETNDGVKHLRLRYNNFEAVAYFKNTPIEVPTDLFQTWYLYESGADLGDTIFYYGENVPNITIASDLSFSGNTQNGGTPFTGNFIYGEIQDFYFEHILRVRNLNPPDTGIPDLWGDWDLISYVVPIEFYIESAPGFYSVFKNTLTLNNTDFAETTTLLYPNPVQSYLQVKSVAPFTKALIYNTLGEMVVETPYTSTINVEALSTAVYFIYIYYEDRVVVKKFIKG